MNFYFLNIFKKHLIKCLILLFIMSSSFANGQNLKDLYYAQPENSGLYLGFIYLNENQFVLAGLHSLYLFNKERIIIDTLVFGKKGFKDNLFRFNLENAEQKTMSISTLNKSLRVQVQNNRFKVLKETTITPKIKLGKLNLTYLLRGVINM